MRLYLTTFVAVIAWMTTSAAADTLRVGVTLHPYYSWVRNITAGTDVEVRSILPGDVDAGAYQPSPDDIRKLADLDAIVVNGVGHDDFIEPMIEAAGNGDVIRIRPNQNTPLIQGVHGGAINSHTFISFTNAIQQTYAIERALGEMRPELRATFRGNSRAYARRLRRVKLRAAEALVEPKEAAVVTVHDGYSYLLQEFGIELVGVVEPAHGLVPSATELRAVVELLKRENARVVFTEERFPAPLLAVLRESAECEIHVLSHVATGDYTDDKFEREMGENVDTLIRALAGTGAVAP